MRHRKNTFKIGRTASHKRCLIANMLKSLIEHGRIETTDRKAKELKKHADYVISLAKKNNLASKRLLKSYLMLSFNKLSSREARKAKNGDISSYNTDRKIFKKIDEYAKKFEERKGGYTRIIKKEFRIGDGAFKSFIEFVQ